MQPAVMPAVFDKESPPPQRRKGAGEGYDARREFTGTFPGAHLRALLSA